MARFRRSGVVRLPANDARRDWARAAWAAAAPRVADPAWRADWLRCEGTWFAGVDCLPNAPDASVAGTALPDLPLIAALGMAPASWNAAQVSVTYPGYPRPKEGESAGAARFRLHRDAAHVDGLLPVGAPPRRYLREPHAFILGIALTSSAPTAAPLVVWPGSHRILGRALAKARDGHVGGVETLDLTEAYGAARRRAFEACRRCQVPLRLGEAVLLHRHMLHGIAPWQADPTDDGRAIAYFRPQLDALDAWFGCGT